VLHQVKYVWGYLRNNAEAQKTTQAVVSAEDPVVRILDVKEGKYGRNLHLFWEEQKPHLVIEDVYTQRAVKRGSTKTSDAALLVNYEVTFRMALCGPARAVESTLNVQLPADPWLMYWHVGKEFHRPMRYFQKKAITNPCSDDDFADLPHPIYYWYDFLPDRHGPDDAGKEFDCRKILKPNRDYFSHALKLKRVAEPSFDFADFRREMESNPGPLNVTILYGVLDHDVTQPDVEGLRAELAEGAPLAERVRDARATENPRERAVRQLLQLLTDLPSVVTVTSHTTALQDGYLRLTLQGTFKRSGRLVRMHLFHGLTNVFGPVPPNHWAIARQAITTEHVVIYVGHSGIGENLKLSQIEKHLQVPHQQLADELAKAPYQVMAFLSCYSYMYFGQDLMNAGGKGREFVFTGTGYGKGEQGSLAVLDLLDQTLLKNSDEKAVVHHVEAEDFILFKAVAPRTR